jgi:hypothetical protein
MQSTQFEFTVGVNPGYVLGTYASVPEIVMSEATDVWHREAEKVFEEEGVYIPAVVTPASVIYRAAWVDPAATGGNVERVVVFAGVYNPEFNPSPTEWRGCVRLLCSKVRKALGQTTATLVMRDCDFTYLKD